MTIIKKTFAPKVVEDCHQLLIWLIPLLDKFPRNRRFTLGERLENGLLEVLTLCTHAAYQGKKQQLLDDANRQLTTLKHLWRLSFVLKVINSKTYEYGVKGLVGIGRQVGAWRKSQ